MHSVTSRDNPLAKVLRGQPPASMERIGLEVLVALLLAPLLAHGLWRPLVHVFGLRGSAWQVTDVALAAAATMALTWNLGRRRSLWLLLLSGSLVAGAGASTLSLGIAGALTLLGVTVALAALLPRISAQLPPSLDGLARRHARIAALYCIASLAVIVCTVRVSTFMGDSDRVDYQAVPGDAFIETHSCLTAYVRASALTRQHVRNVYADHWWHGSNGLPLLPPGTQNPYTPFHLDNFSYPPPFLLLVTPLSFLQGDFAAQRALWFGMNALLLALGLWVVARWIDGANAHRALLLAPLFLGCVPTLAMLQIGNFQIAGVVLAILAMVAFDRQQWRLGGVLLAATLLSKLSPGILVFTLLIQRRFRAVVYCAGFCALLLGASVIQLGTEPLHAFLTFAVPRLGTGAAFPFIDTESGVVTNLSPFGIPFKLQVFGVHVADPWLLGRVIVRVYTSLLLVLTLATARRPRDRTQQAIAWMVLLALASMQSPFAPAYAAFGLLWATTLLATQVQSRLGVAGLVGLWVVALVVPQGLTVAQHAAHALMQSVLLVAISAALLLRRVAPAREGFLSNPTKPVAAETA